MKNIKILISIIIIAIILLIGLMGGYLEVGYLLYNIFPCKLSPQNSFPCYGEYDIYLMILLLITIIVSFIIIITKYIKKDEQ